MVLRVCLDVNVWVSHYLSINQGRDHSAAQLVVRSAFDGYCRLGPLQPIVSHVMLDTLHGVLCRLGFADNLADAARHAIADTAAGGVLRLAPHGVLGGGVQPVRDVEDSGVLDTAIAGQADLLVTNNLRDFVRGPKSNLDADVVRDGTGRLPDVLRLRHPALPKTLVIASVPAAKAWLIDGIHPPGDLLRRFSI